MHASKKILKKICFWKKIEIKFLNSWPNFRKFDKKTLMSEKFKFSKKWFLMSKTGFSGKSYYWLIFFGPKIKEKKLFLKIFKNLRSYDFFCVRQNPGWLRCLSLKTVSTLNRRTWWCCPLNIHSEPEQFGHVDFDDMTKRANFVLSCLYFEWKA